MHIGEMIFAHYDTQGV